MENGRVCQCATQIQGRCDKSPLSCDHRPHFHSPHSLKCFQQGADDLCSRMKLQARFNLSIFLVIFAAFVVTQVIQFQRISSLLGSQERDSLAHEESSFAEAMADLRLATESSLVGHMADGEMDKFQRNLEGLREVKSLRELSLASNKGRITFSTDPQRLRQELPAELLNRLTTNIERVERKVGDLLEVYQPLKSRAACYECHKDFRNTAVGGVLIYRFNRSALIEAQSHWTDFTRTISGNLLLMSCVSLVLILAISGSLVWWLVQRQIITPLRATGNVIHRVADRDLRTKVAQVSSDEVGEIGDSINKMVDDLRGHLVTIAEDSRKLSHSSEQLSQISTEVLRNSSFTSQQANMVAAASEQVSRNVGVMAMSTEEMQASIQEISNNTNQAATIASQAETLAHEGNVSMSRLGHSSQEIGKVISVIQRIAAQTNLLALNATIEAARAGEMGKGFAVVASEVKLLATQTAAATKEVEEKVLTMQSDTQASMLALEKITAVITQINQLQVAIASAVEEQAVTTNEISRNVSEASTGVDNIAQNIQSVSKAAAGTSDGASKTADNAAELARLAVALKKVLDEYRLS